MSAATAAISMLTVPVMGTVVAAFMLGEPLGMREVLAMAPLAAEARVRAATEARMAAGTATAPQRTLARYIGGLR